MNQFDKLFGKKLNDEQVFGGQKRSWTQLNHDLSTFEVGSSVAAKSLAMWKAISVIAILSSVALLWERQHLVRENELLKTTPSQPQNIPLAKQDVAYLPENTSTEIAAISPIERPTPFVLRPNHVPQNQSASYLESSNQNVFTKVTPSPVTPTGATASKLNPNPKTEPALPYPVPAVEVAQNTMTATGTDAPSSVDSQHLALISNQLLGETNTPTKIDTLNIDAQSNLAVADTMLQKPALKPDSIQQSPLVNAVPVIDPVLNRNKKWQVGVRLSLGQPMPKEKGLSMVTSQGVALAFRVWKGFSLTASADFMQFDVQTDSIPRHYCAIKLPPPGPGHHYFDLENVSSNQIMQQYNLGLRYSFKLAGPWRLSANAAHTWVHQPSRLASLRFEDMQPHGGGPGWHPDDEYLTIQSFKTWTSNIIRLGLGVQYETPRWSFGILGDYAQKLSDNKPSFDTAYASAEIMYKF